MPSLATLRTLPAAQTLAAAKRLMPALGITRITDITRLDCLGLPVVAGIRPRGRTLRVHSGGALTAAKATVAALMEAVEYAVAERVSAAGADAHLPLNELVAQLPDGLGVFDFAPRLGVTLPVDFVIGAVVCEELSTGKSALLPAELAMLPGPGTQPVLFGSPSNGMASGNTLDEATLFALLEVLERDAIAMNRAGEASEKLDNNSLPAPFRSMSKAWQARGVDLIVRRIPSELGLPCFEAHLYEATSADVNLSVGTGLHFDRFQALARAISEAVQSRVGTIHGGRDDLEHFYSKYDSHDPIALSRAETQLLESLNDSTKTVRFRDIPSEHPSSSKAALDLLLDRLNARHFCRVYRRQMKLPKGDLDMLGLHVVKVVVPKCEATSASGPPRMGPRLWKRLMSHA